MDNNEIILSSCKTRNIKYYNWFNRIYYKLLLGLFKSDKLLYSTNCRRQGWLMTLNLEVYKSLDFKIPNYLKLWYGDDWIWSQIINNNCKYAVYTNRYALHIRSSTTSKFSNIIKKDSLNLKKYGDWFFKVTDEMHSKKYI
jgi:hypothetical protein